MSYKTSTRFTMTRLVVITVLILLLSGGAAFGRSFTPANGATLPTYYPSSFQSTGAIQSVDARGIVINGIHYAFSMNLLVHSTTTEFSARNELKAGKEVGYSFATGTNNKLTLTEVWLLPDDSLLKH